MKTIKTWLESMKKAGIPVGTVGVTYPIHRKKQLIEIHYTTGKSLPKIAVETGVNINSLYEWKKMYGTKQTHVIYGNSTAPDIRTKCLAIADELDHGMSTVAIALKYHITRQQYYNWKSNFKDRYKEYMDLPDGTTRIAKVVRHVYGDDNIISVRELLTSNAKKLADLVKANQAFGFDSTEAEAAIAEIAVTTKVLKGLK